jgi:surface carbohydrate biosynthesis protein
MHKVVLPIDIKQREFLGKLWLANNIVSEKNKVFIGDRRTIFKAWPDIEPDFYLAMGAMEERINLFKKLSKNDVTIGIHDTEGMYGTDGEFVDKYSAEALDTADIYFSWGNTQAKSLEEKFGEERIKIIVSGTPRFDLLHPELRDIYSNPMQNRNVNKFVLFITNFTAVNNYDPDRRMGVTEEYYKWQMSTRDKFLESISKIQTNSNFSAIIRPHPAESPSAYNEFASDFDHVYVEDDESVRDYLHSASAIVHSGSTVAVESNIMDTPTIGFNPEPWYPLPDVTSRVSYNINSIEELITKIDKIDSKGSSALDYPSIDGEISNKLHNCFSPKAGSIISREIKNEIENKPRRSQWDSHGYPTASALEKLIYNRRVSDFLRRHSDKVSKFQRLFSSTVPSISGQRFNMFPEITSREIKDYSNMMVPDSDISVRRVRNWANLFEITPSSD